MTDPPSIYSDVCCCSTDSGYNMKTSGDVKKCLPYNILKHFCNLHIYLFWTKSIEIVDNFVCSLFHNERTIILCLSFEQDICVFRWDAGSKWVNFEASCLLNGRSFQLTKPHSNTVSYRLGHVGKILFRSKGLR